MFLHIYLILELPKEGIAMAKYLCMDLPSEPEEMPDELLVSDEEMELVEDEIGQDAEKLDALRFLWDCQGNIVKALNEVANSIGMTYEVLLGEISNALSELDEGCRSLLSDPDLSDGLPEVVRALTIALLFHTGITQPWVAIVAVCVVIAYKKGVRLYLTA